MWGKPDGRHAGAPPRSVEGGLRDRCHLPERRAVLDQPLLHRAHRDRPRHRRPPRRRAEVRDRRAVRRAPAPGPRPPRGVRGGLEPAHPDGDAIAAPLVHSGTQTRGERQRSATPPRRAPHLLPRRDGTGDVPRRRATGRRRAVTRDPGALPRHGHGDRLTAGHDPAGGFQSGRTLPAPGTDPGLRGDVRRRDRRVDLGRRQAHRLLFQPGVRPRAGPADGGAHRPDRRPRQRGPQGRHPAAGEARGCRRGSVPAQRPADGDRQHPRRAGARSARGRGRRAASRRPGRRPLLREDGRLRPDRRHHRHRRRPGAGAPEPRPSGDPRAARRGSVRRHAVGRALGQLRLAAHERQDPAQQRPAHRGDGTGPRRHRRDPGRHQSARTANAAAVDAAPERGAAHRRLRCLPGHRQTTRDSTRTPSRPTTEMIVSITDQLLMVCPTLIPKYSFTSQKPASLTCEKNSEPAPMARARRATVDPSSPPASGATMPAAVIVATVADPVASRIRTAISQPSTSTLRLRFLAASPTSWPTPASTSTCLKPPPAATMSRIPAIPGSEPPTVLEIFSRPKPTAAPSVNIASRTPANSATTGVPTMSRTVRSVDPLSRVSSPIARRSISPTGSRTVTIVAPRAGWRTGRSAGVVVPTPAVVPPSPPAVRVTVRRCSGSTGAPRSVRP